MKKLIFTLLFIIIGFIGFSQPANDDPCNATHVEPLPDCVNTLGSNLNATASTGVPAPGCANYLGGDVWFSVVVPASGNLTFSSSGVNGSGVTDNGIAIYSGTCNSLNLISCNDDSGPGLFGQISNNSLTPGDTIWMRVWEYGNNSFGLFNICIVDNNLLTPPPNDDPCNAINLPIDAAGACTSTVGYNTNATASAGVPAPGCANYNGGDVWYSITVPASGSANFSTFEANGFTDGGLAIYSGTCGALTLISCNDDSGPGLFGEISSTTLTPGATIWIRVWEYGNNSFGTFNICVSEPDACGNTGPTVGTNDYCNTPATLTSGGTSFSANTSTVFTQDLPGNLGSAGVFCGSIENNSWYQFTAGATTETFPITSVTGCTQGIQAEAYSITYDSKGCCNVFSSVSNCYSPANTSTGTVTATGLTIGNQYMLMIDGYNGNGCDFTISGWDGINILPVELTHFTGFTNENENLLTWTTASESNNDYFYIEKSMDGINYKKIGEVQGSGNSSVRIDYEFSDSEINNSIVYYRLTQVDFDGTKEKVGELTMTRELNNVSAYPNPSKGELSFTFNTSKPGIYNVEFIDINGKTVIENITIENSNTVKSIVFSELNKGLYFVRITDSKSNVIETIKVIKE